MNIVSDADILDQNRQASELEEILRFQRALQDITNLIHTAPDVRQIYTSTRQLIQDLFDVESVRLYIPDQQKKELFPVMGQGEKVNSIRLPIDSRSIPGHAAQALTLLNIADACDSGELKEIDEGLSHNTLVDRKLGVRTREVMAAAAVYEDELMGVIEVSNRRQLQGKFVDEEPVLLMEIAESLGIAIYNLQKKKRRTKFDYLVDTGSIKQSDLDQSWPEARKSGLTMEEYLMRIFRVSKADIGKALEDYYECRFVQYEEGQLIPEDLLKNLRPEFLRRELWVPLKKTATGIVLLMDDPRNLLKKDQIISFLKSKEVEFCIALKEDIIKYIDYFYRRPDVDESTVNEILGRIEFEAAEEEEEDLIPETDSVIMQLVNKIIYDGYLSRASDIHIEPNAKKKTLDIRFRIDGDCMKYESLPYSYRAATASRIKIMANLDITERRLPQDGKIRFRKAGNDLELRVATVPTQGNVEDIVMRILAKGETMTLKQMALSAGNFENFLKILEKPYGIILVVGPTGSGKTTTLHAALRHLNTPGTKIWTAEDPVEITQEGLRQVQVKPKIGFDFSHAMRSFLRADPDIIMVGEMRDYETAKIGVEASLTGHLVLSTLHTNSAPETIIRLLDMGIDPFNFADSLLGVLAQRLVRVLCKVCKEAYEPDEDVLNDMRHGYGEEHFSELGKIRTLYRPRGCSACNNTGFKGRMGVHELLVSSDQIKKLVARRNSVEDIRKTAVSEGMRTLLQDGIRKVMEGHTDLKQVLAVCMR